MNVVGEQENQTKNPLRKAAETKKLFVHSKSTHQTVEEPLWHKSRIQYPPVCIIVKGRLDVIASDPDGKPLVLHTLNCGHSFGYTDLLKIKVSFPCS